MRILNKTLFLLIVLATSIFFACKKGNQAEPEDETTIVPNESSSLLKIGETYIIGAKAKALIYAPRVLETGYNHLYITFIDSVDGTHLNEGCINVLPLLNTSSVSSNSPVENSIDSVAENNYFKSAVVFPISGTSAEYSLQITFHNHKNGLSGIGNLGINVSASNPIRFKNIILTADSNKQVYISLIQPEQAKVGKNNFEIVLHQKLSNTNYAPINNYSIEIEPEMASMEHGSPFNIDPILTENGHYFGRVNFTMTGSWIVHIRLYKNGTLLSNDQVFDMSVQ